MTELREKMREIILEELIDVRAGYKDVELSATETTDAIMALFAGGSAMGSFDFLDFLRRKNSWSEAAFGPVEHRGPLGPLDHLRKEIAEAEAAPGDAMEFADLVFLATDAAHRAGHTPEVLAKALEDKLEINRARDWGDWRTKPADTAIEHNREGEHAIDRPAPVVVKPLEPIDIARLMLDYGYAERQYGSGTAGDEHSVCEARMKAARRISECITVPVVDRNKVRVLVESVMSPDYLGTKELDETTDYICASFTTREEVEREVRADERERLARLAHENAHDPNWQENLDGCQCLARSDWLEVEAFIRAQEGDK